MEFFSFTQLSFKIYLNTSSACFTVIFYGVPVLLMLAVKGSAGLIVEPKYFCIEISIINDIPVF